MGLTKKMYEEIEQLRTQAENGEINELQAYIELKEFEEFVSESKKAITKSALRLVELEQDNKTIQFGYNIAKQQKTTWKYDHIQVWQEKKSELAEIETRAKAAYQLQTKQGFGEDLIDQFETGKSQESGIADVNTGEIIEAAIATYSEPFLKIDKVKIKPNKK